jgi:hypothetical protein
MLLSFFYREYNTLRKDRHDEGIDKNDTIRLNQRLYQEGAPTATPWLRFSLPVSSNDRAISLSYRSPTTLTAQHQRDEPVVKRKHGRSVVVGCCMSFQLYSTVVCVSWVDRFY